MTLGQENRATRLDAIDCREQFLHGGDAHHAPVGGGNTGALGNHCGIHELAGLWTRSRWRERTFLLHLDRHPGRSSLGFEQQDGAQ